MRPDARWISFLALAAIGAGGCAARQDPTLDQLRAEYNAKQPRLDQLAPIASNEARVSIDKVAGAIQAEADSGEVTHLEYVARQRIATADARAAEREANDQVAQLAEERRRTELSSRDAAVATAQARSRQAYLDASAERARADALARELADLQAKQTERGLVLTLGDVLFDVDRASLKPGAQQSLAKLVQFLGENPERKVLIEGHTDNTGSRDHNEQLSEDRAQSVDEFLVTHGVSPDRIQTRGLAFDYPVATNATQAGRQLNRRVEVIILDAGKSFDQASRS